MKNIKSMSSEILPRIKSIVGKSALFIALLAVGITGCKKYEEQPSSDN